MNGNIAFYAPNDLQHMCRAALIQHFHLVTLIDLTVALTFTYEPILIWYIFHPIGRMLAKFWFAAFMSPVSVANKAKSDEFDLRPDQELTCDLFRGS